MPKLLDVARSVNSRAGQGDSSVTDRATLDVDPDLVSWLGNQMAARRDERGGGGGHTLTFWDAAVLVLCVERAFAALERYRVLERVRISPNRITTLLHALFTTYRKRSSLDGM